MSDFFISEALIKSMVILRNICLSFFVQFTPSPQIERARTHTVEALREHYLKNTFDSCELGGEDDVLRPEDFLMKIAIALQS